MCRDALWKHEPQYYSMCLCVSSQWVVVLFWYGIHVANVATWGHASAISTGQI